MSFTQEDLTNAEFAALQKRYDTQKNPNACPFCGSGDTEGGSVDISGKTADQRVDCNACESVWYDIYVRENMAIGEMTELGAKKFRSSLSKKTSVLKTKK